MPHQKREFINGETYHVILRRIGNELLFGDEHDNYRGIFSIYEFNNANPVRIAQRRQERARFKFLLGLTLQESNKVRPSKIEEEDKREPLVEILCFAFMPNHIHLLVKQLEDGGISKFMQKLGGGYACYFKEKYDQKGKGHFFQDRFRAVHIESENQLLITFVYIHTNAISLIEPGWKENGIKSAANVIKFLEEEYRWSSYWDYLGKKNFPSVTKREWLLEVIGGPEACKQLVDSWIMQKEGLKKMVNNLDKILAKQLGQT